MLFVKIVLYLVSNMTKFKFKVTTATTIEDAENELLHLKGLNIHEIQLNHILKITRFLGVEEPSGRKSGGGSSVRFFHKYLVNYQHYYEGYFSIHLKHTGKSERIISKRDFVIYFLPPLLGIIKIKREKGELK